MVAGTGHHASSPFPVNRVCLDCGRVTQRRRCPEHQRQWDAQRNARPGRRIYGGSWKRDSQRAIAASPVCAWCGSLSDLTTDHTTGLTLCRACNTRERNARYAR